MPKKVKAVIKLYCSSGQANPAPPVGPALGQHGLNIMEFCKQFNAKTQGQGKEGLTLPVIITAYEDRSFTFIIKSSPSSTLLKRACGIAKASSIPHKEKAGVVTKAQVKEIAKTKINDLNTDNIEKAMKIVEGTARSMGIEVAETEAEAVKIRAGIKEREEESKAAAPVAVAAPPKEGAPAKESAPPKEEKK